jgi:hypothetical protein
VFPPRTATSWCGISKNAMVIYDCGGSDKCGRVECSYQSTLNQLLGDRQPEGKPNSQLAAATMRIMAVLQTNLDSKAKFYRDPALTHIFLMNNIHYMVRSVRRCVPEFPIVCRC